MFLATEVTRTSSLTAFLVALFEAVAFVGTMIWVKVVLYRRRMREDEAHRLQRQRELDHAVAPLHSKHAGFTPSNPPPASAAADRTLRNRERKLRKRLNRTSAGTDGLLLNSRGMLLKASSGSHRPREISPNPKTVSYENT